MQSYLSKALYHMPKNVCLCVPFQVKKIQIKLLMQSFTMLMYAACC
ncbi:Uncharacterised protein [Acinetobacter baumannii]|nr:Uncharacterised protein [Acinetobacter baumannii]